MKRMLMKMEKLTRKEILKFKMMDRLYTPHFIFYITQAFTEFCLVLISELS